MTEHRKLTTAQIEAVLAVVEDATGHDRIADWRIAQAISVPNAGAWPDIEMWPPFMEGSKTDKAIPRYSESFDAALLALEALLPGWVWTVARMHGHEEAPEGKPYFADCASVAWVESNTKFREQAEAYGATPALALLRAVFTVCLYKDAEYDLPSHTEMDEAFEAHAEQFST